MMRSVFLSALPQSVRFPEDLRERVHFDEKKCQLQFDGFMSKRDFDKLIVLHNDIEYQRALEQLFQICVFTSDRDKPAPASRRHLVYVGAALAVILLISTGSLVLLLR